MFFHHDSAAEIPSNDELFSPNTLLDIKDTHVRPDLPLKLYAISNYFIVMEDGNGEKSIKMSSNGLFKYSAKFLCETSAGGAFESDFNSDDLTYDNVTEQYVVEFYLLPKDVKITRVEIYFNTTIKACRMKVGVTYKPSAKDNTKLYFAELNGTYSKIGIVGNAKRILLKNC